MIKPSAETMHLAQSLFGLHEDLGSFTYATVLRGGFEHYVGLCAGFPAEKNYNLCHYIELALKGAEKVITHSNRNEAIPGYPLTLAAINTARTSNRLEAGRKGAQLCLAAELMMQPSLELNRAGKLPSHGIPAAVLFDIDRTPFAYMKSIGLRAAFSWRDAQIETATGPKFVPAGSFFKVRYGKDGSVDIQKTLPSSGNNASLISLENYVPPTYVSLIRFSAFLIDDELARSAYAYETGPAICLNQYKYLGAYIPTVLELGMEGIGEQVQSLLRNGQSYSLDPPAI